MSAPDHEAYDVIVIGAGPTGLSAAYHLGKDTLLLERNATVGGWCRSVTVDGYTFDHAGHIMFSNDPYVHALYDKLLNGNVHWQDREAWIYSKNVHTRYPFQSALHGLPPDVLKECLVGAIEARFGPLNGGTGAGSHTIAGEAAGRIEPASFEEFIYRVWGAGVAKHFAIPYNEKLWTVPLSEMETSWLGGRVPLPNLEEMIDGALRFAPKPVGPNARFGYPLRGGFQALMDGFLPLIEGDVVLGATVEKVCASSREVELQDGSTFHYRRLVSTAPLPELVRMLGPEASEPVRRAAEKLRHVSVRCVNLGVERPNLTEKHWVYYPEDTVFHRVFMQGNASPHCSPPNGFGLTCEITYSPAKPLPCEGDALIDRCIEDCRRVGLIERRDRIPVRVELDMPDAYVVYDHGRKRHVDAIRAWLHSLDILLAGRYAEWKYFNSDHAFIAGKNAADATRLPPHERIRRVSARAGRR
jgi:protoporphyrinogen oxidase